MSNNIKSMSDDVKEKDEINNISGKLYYVLT